MFICNQIFLSNTNNLWKIYQIFKISLQPREKAFQILKTKVSLNLKEKRKNIPNKNNSITNLFDPLQNPNKYNHRS